MFEFRTTRRSWPSSTARRSRATASRARSTPDHAIRTKNVPLIAPAPEAGKLDAFKAEAKAALDTLRRRLPRLFRSATTCSRCRPRPSSIPMPRVVLVPGVGLFGVGSTSEGRQDRRRPRRDHGRGDRRRRAARHLRVHPRARHLRHRVLVARAGQAGRGGREAAGAAHRRGHRRRLGHRRGDGRRACAKDGAEVVVLDRDVGKVKGFAIACDVTDPAQVRAAFDRIAATYGGVDIVVSNAGAAWQGRIGDVDDKVAARRASSSTSGRTRAWRRTPCASCARRAWAAACCSTPPSRRSIPAPTSAPTACPRRRRCS